MYSLPTVNNHGTQYSIVHPQLVVQKILLHLGHQHARWQSTLYANSQDYTHTLMEERMV